MQEIHFTTDSLQQAQRSVVLLYI